MYMYIVVSMMRVCVSVYLYMYMYIHVHAMWLAVLQCLRMCEPDGMPTFNPLYTIVRKSIFPSH